MPLRRLSLSTQYTDVADCVYLVESLFCLLAEIPFKDVGNCPRLQSAREDLSGINSQSLTDSVLKML
ncbi:hypothetical protein EYF80_000026 [Liparis tanakae]|uniref:Uncharacterized protein n=1 Tax=Liparis tanakae TaxID=230148 RepID=A0A4Z2JHY8_9TELE|nr:hypothetical protein EYF80_000026 [Liparis tanakae]